MRKSKKYRCRKYSKTKKVYNLYGGENSNANIGPPTTTDNIKKVADIGLQIGNNIVANGIDYAGNKVKTLVEMAGVDTNKSVNEEIKRIGHKMAEIKTALNTPEGQAALRDLQDVSIEIGEKVIAPGVEKITESVIENTGPIMNKGTKAVLDGLSATPIGPLIDIPRFLADLGGIVEDSAAMTADVLSISRDTMDKSKESIGKIQSAWNKLQNAVEGGNQLLSRGLDNVSRRVDDYGKTLVSPIDAQMGGQISGQISSQFGGYRNQAKMIGGRTRKSKMEFMMPYRHRHKFKTYKKL
jgi:hypothetical protein